MAIFFVALARGRLTKFISSATRRALSMLRSGKGHLP